MVMDVIGRSKNVFCKGIVVSTYDILKVSSSCQFDTQCSQQHTCEAPLRASSVFHLLHHFLFVINSLATRNNLVNNVVYFLLLLGILFAAHFLAVYTVALRAIVFMASAYHVVHVRAHFFYFSCVLEYSVLIGFVGVSPLCVANSPFPFSLSCILVLTHCFQVHTFFRTTSRRNLCFILIFEVHCCMYVPCHCFSEQSVSISIVGIVRYVSKGDPYWCQCYAIYRNSILCTFFVHS